MDAEVPDPARYEPLFARLPERFRKYDTAEFHAALDRSRADAPRMTQRQARRVSSLLWPSG
jgi:hypothetical protein